MTFTYEDFEKIYESTKRDTLKYISSKAMNISDIEDMYQEVYVKAYDAFTRGESFDDPQAFIIGIAKHVVSDNYRLTYRIRKWFAARRSDDDEDDSPAEIADDTDIEELVENKVLYDKVVSEICSMGSETQRIFYLRYVLGLSLAQTADTLGIRESRVQQLLYKGLRQLRRKYGKEK